MQIRTFLKKTVPVSTRSASLGKKISKTGIISDREIFDDESTFRRNVDLVSDLLLTSKKTLLFCGAGLSTPSGIPDYRSGYDTKLKTGPGKWEREKHENKPYEKPTTIRPSVEAWPNDGHLALKALEGKGLIHHFVSQNVDGLLSRSGIPQNKLSELHGNIYKERCLSCGTNYWRDFSTLKSDQRRITERRCLCTDK